MRWKVDVLFGLPTFAMVGLPDASVRESRDRVRGAFATRASTFRASGNRQPGAGGHPQGRPAFDLPIALGVLAAAGSCTSRHR